MASQVLKKIWIVTFYKHIWSPFICLLSLMADPYGLKWPKANIQAYIRLTKLCVLYNSIVFPISLWQCSEQGCGTTTKRQLCCGEIGPNGNSFTQHLGTAGLLVHTVWCDQSWLYEWDTIKINKYKLTPSLQRGRSWLVTKQNRGGYMGKVRFPWRLWSCGAFTAWWDLKERRVWPCG